MVLQQRVHTHFQSLDPKVKSRTVTTFHGSGIFFLPITKVRIYQFLIASDRGFGGNRVEFHMGLIKYFLF